jgi:hypothetical protein
MATPTPVYIAAKPIEYRDGGEHGRTKGLRGHAHTRGCTVAAEDHPLLKPKRTPLDRASPLTSYSMSEVKVEMSSCA